MTDSERSSSQLGEAILQAAADYSAALLASGHQCDGEIQWCDWCEERERTREDLSDPSRDA